MFLVLEPDRVLLSGRMRASATLYLARFFPMRALWDRSLPPPVAETGRRSVGNRKERPEGRDYASSQEEESAMGNARESRTLPDSKGAVAEFFVSATAPFCWHRLRTSLKDYRCLQ